MQGVGMTAPIAPENVDMGMDVDVKVIDEDGNVEMSGTATKSIKTIHLQLD